MPLKHFHDGIIIKHSNNSSAARHGIPDRSQALKDGLAKVPGATVKDIMISLHGGGGVYYAWFGP